MGACRRALEEEIRACMGDNPSPMYHMVRYHLGWVDQRGQEVSLPGGKMLRPLLCLLSCQAVGGDFHGALPAAVAIEMVHNFSLIHDDIQDQSPQRRHRATVWWVWGQAQAITAGDGLHTLAHLAHMRLLERGVSPDVTLRTLGFLDRACLELCEGQHLDLSFEGRMQVDLADYTTMVSKKTAALFAASARIGAMLGAEDEEIARLLEGFGEELGLAFQIQDDILGIWGLEEATGKPSLDDIRAKKKSLPIVHAMATAQGRDRGVLQEAYAEAILSDVEVAAVLAVLEAAGSRQYCQSLAQSYGERARCRLEALSLEPSAAAALKELAEQAVLRNA